MKLNSKISTTDDKYGVMSFFLGYKFKQGEAAPNPTENGLYLNKLQSKKYGVISYEGNSNEKKQTKNLFKLKNYLSSQNIKFVDDYYFYAVYDSPFGKGHNEIWIELLNARAEWVAPSYC